MRSNLGARTVVTAGTSDAATCRAGAKRRPGALLAAASVTITAAPTVAAVVEFLTVFPPPSPYSADDNAGIIVDAACGGAAVVYSSSSPSVLARAGLHAQAPSHVVWCYGACTARQHARVRTRCKV